uniref:Uncharacterized protein n=1 Tax=Rhizophora mucronata TaxID=61149 RepID=A0A2P2N2K5_RHIMU
MVWNSKREKMLVIEEGPFDSAVLCIQCHIRLPGPPYQH